MAVLKKGLPVLLKKCNKKLNNMKQMLSILLIPVMIACNESNRANLEGTYVAFHEHEFGATNDTLVVGRSTNGEGIYAIERCYGLVKKYDGRLFPKEWKTESRVLVYDSDKRMLTEQKTGKVLLWDNDQQRLLMGKILFTKIK